MVNDQVLSAVKRIVELLVDGRYGDLETVTSGVRLSAQEIRAAVEDYGRTLVVPSAQAYDLLDAIEVREALPRRWSVTMPLWTREEGRSDLSLELTVVAEGPQSTRVELDDLHVL